MHTQRQQEASWYTRYADNDGVQEDLVGNWATLTVVLFAKKLKKSVSV